ncbi:MAG: Ig-like domain-containing protein [Erysipelotrichaceae bacterium]|jgi:hypothetical protein|nr:Ig-like domain-containing protein [Erysipelotrichaceae bacterium]
MPNRKIDLKGFLLGSCLGFTLLCVAAFVGTNVSRSSLETRNVKADPYLVNSIDFSHTVTNEEVLTPDQFFHVIDEVSSIPGFVMGVSAASNVFTGSTGPGIIGDGFVTFESFTLVLKEEVHRIVITGGAYNPVGANLLVNGVSEFLELTTTTSDFLTYDYSLIDASYAVSFAIDQQFAYLQTITFYGCGVIGLRPEAESCEILGLSNVEVNMTIDLDVIVFPLGAMIEAIWSSETLNVATVNAAGLVTGISPGAVVITVRSSTNPLVMDEHVVLVGDGALNNKVWNFNSTHPEDGADIEGLLFDDTMVIASVVAVQNDGKNNENLELNSSHIDLFGDQSTGQNGNALVFTMGPGVRIASVQIAAYKHAGNAIRAYCTIAGVRFGVDNNSPATLYPPVTIASDSPYATNFEIKNTSEGVNLIIAAIILEYALI